VNQDEIGELEPWLDVRALRDQLRDASRLAVKQLATELSQQTVYGFALCAYWDGFDHVFDFFPSAATEDNVDLDLRWSPFDWQYERLGDEFFVGVREFVRSAYNQEPQFRERDDCLSLFLGDVLSQLVLALHDLRKDGIFDQFTPITVFCAQPESDGWLERSSGKLLNYETLDKTFLQEFAPIDPAYDEHDSTFRRFRDRLRQCGELPNVWQEHK
jgi:Domain of unknown function (DUF4303)